MKGLPAQAERRVLNPAFAHDDESQAKPAASNRCEERLAYPIIAFGKLELVMVIQPAPQSCQALLRLPRGLAVIEDDHADGEYRIGASGELEA